MDQERQIRFLYPPVIIILYLLWALHQDHRYTCRIEDLLQSSSNEQIFSNFIAGGIIVLVAGYLVGTASYLFLRLSFLITGWFCTRSNQSHEVCLDNESERLIWSVVMPHRIFRRHDITFAGVILDFEKMNAGTHNWIVRRWNAFNVSINISFGLALVLLLCSDCFLGLKVHSWAWFSIGAAAIGAFLINAIISWKDTMRMLKFYSEYLQQDPVPDSRTTT